MQTEPFREWGADDAAAAIQEGFRTLKFTSIWCRSGNRHQRIGAGPAASAAFDVLAFAETVLGHGSDEHRAVMIWGRATSRNGETVASIRECSEALGINKRTLLRRKDRACARIAQARNVADRPEAQD